MGATNFNSARPAGYQAISASSSTAVSPTIPTAVGPVSTANYAFFVCEGVGVRWRDDGTAPTNAVGTPLAAGAALEYDGNLYSIQFVSQGATATIHANYYRMG